MSSFTIPRLETASKAETTEAFAIVGAVLLGEGIKLVVLKRSLTRLTGRQFNYRDTYAAYCLLRLAGVSFEGGRYQEAKNQTKFDAAVETLKKRYGTS